MAAAVCRSVFYIFLHSAIYVSPVSFFFLYSQLILLKHNHFNQLDIIPASAATSG